jgi:hypothetical protein
MKTNTFKSFRMRSYRKHWGPPIRIAEIVEKKYFTVFGAFSRKPLLHILLRISAPANPYGIYSCEKMRGLLRVIERQVLSLIAFGSRMPVAQNSFCVHFPIAT